MTLVQSDFSRKVRWWAFRFRVPPRGGNQLWGAATQLRIAWILWIWVCDISCGFTRYRFLLRRVGLLAPQRQQRSHSPQTLGSGRPGRTNSSCDYETAGILGHPHDLSNTRGFMKLLARSKLLPRPAYSRRTIRLSFPLFYLYYTPSFSSCQLFMTYYLIFFATFLPSLIVFSEALLFWYVRYGLFANCYG